MTRIAIIGRPNVGKSTLFNRLCRRRVAITEPTPGVTRDSLVRTVEFAGHQVELVDTGGIGAGETHFLKEVAERSRAEIARADLTMFVVDVNEFAPEDEEILALVRRAGGPTILVVNKCDNDDRLTPAAEFWKYGIDPVVPVSAEHGIGVADLEEAAERLLGGGDVTTGQPEETAEETDAAEPLRLAIVGRPNSGKSTLLNRLVGDERALVSEVAGTTRDTVEAEFACRGRTIRVMDTAGLRKKAQIRENIEYYATQRAFDALDAADVAILLVDVTEGLGEQDKKIADRIVDRGLGVVIALTKWDTVQDVPNRFEAERDRLKFRFPVFQHAPIVRISAQSGLGIAELLNMIFVVERELIRRVDTGPLNRALQQWVDEIPPPRDGRRLWKFRYITQTGTAPVEFVLFVNRKKGIPESYLSFLRNRIRREFGFHHVPIRLSLRE